MLSSAIQNDSEICDLTAKLIDFGIVQSLNTSRDQWISKEAGTRGYAAPEILAESETYGTPADVWSFGCLIHVMLTVRLPLHHSLSMRSSQIQQAPG